MESVLINSDTHNKSSLHRIFEILIASVLLILASPLFIIGCILSFLDLRENPIFSQIRVGKHNSHFHIYKIKTIADSSDHKITFLGEILRKCKIDEIPQLINVIKGDMRIIGPRPEQPQYVDEFLKIDPNFSLRHEIKPGITGWAQVCLPKAKPKDNLDKLKYDLFYVNNRSIKLDAIIILKTIKIIITLNSN
jgi:lipopolysaccharide/colanic/teichoic acid biosynthesis glycosyltransferase